MEKATSEDEVNKKFAEARYQTELYSGSVLAGVELTTYRYVIVVSRDRIAVPANLTKNGVVYRHINIAVDPQTPSQEVKRRRS